MFTVKATNLRGLDYGFTYSDSKQALLMIRELDFRGAEDITLNGKIVPEELILKLRG